ncbi:nuclear pore complex protein NUP96-like isoform X2 [Aristolochia californica]|uniref:nuclear pore complex protein NUP96-like isoform X2 n=1 Tax=Aristolochia californica TaxID=171875 RepID=UPI0035D9EE10
MDSAASLSVTGYPDVVRSIRGLCGVDVGTSDSNMSSQFKRRKVISSTAPSNKVKSKLEASLPVLFSSGYFMKPSLKEMAALELAEQDYCSRVEDFTVGRVGYGHVQFLEETDVRWLDLDKIVKFNRHEVVVYTDEINKPPVGQGLNKAAEVTLILQKKLPVSDEIKQNKLLRLLRNTNQRQGAKFISFDPTNGEWKFSVSHFSRFGLNEEEDEDDDDIVMDDTLVQEPQGATGVDELEVDEEPQVGPSGTVLSHSLPAHLGLDPVKMQETRMLMFPVEEEEDVESSGRDYWRTGSTTSNKYFPGQYSSLKAGQKSNPSALRKSPQALLEYKITPELDPSRNILMIRQNRSLPLRATKVEGFKLDWKQETPITNSHSSNIVDAALFMGRSFRVGWGPNGILVHTGTPVGSTGYKNELSSIIHVEKVASNKAVRDENDEEKEALVNSCFVSPLELHKSIVHETTDVVVDGFRLKLRKLICSRLTLPEICREYIRIIETQLEVSGSSASSSMYLMHQVMVWELIKVMFSEREISSQSKPQHVDADVDDGEDMIDDVKDGPRDLDPEAYPLVRRAEFSYWLQESVCHRVQEEVSSLGDLNDLEHIFFLLTGRQLDSAVELAASRGDVRMACLLSEAGGSMVNRSDMARQLEIWRTNGLDFRFIEKERLKLYELLAGNIHGALSDSKIDWKRYLGLLMWYQLPPDTPLPVIITTYQQLLIERRAPYPIPVYIDEGPVRGAPKWSPGDRFDLTYYLMLLHADEEKAYGVVKTMFSAFASTHDPFDYHMIWHQRALLEAVGAFTSNDLHVLDMSFISQLLYLGLCHWAIYVVLHMPIRDDFPHIHSTVIREILFQYCECWSRNEIQHKFIEDLGVPSEWLHEALAIYFQYHGDLPMALEHFLQCSNWQKAHSIFMTSVAHTLFSSSKHSEIWRLANWTLGAGIYIEFYVLKSSLQEESTTGELDSLEKKTEACRHFFECLNKSLSVWGNKLSIDARATYSRMAEELCSLLMLDGAENSTREAQMSCFETILTAPIPEDRRACHLQDAVSVFTYFLLETAP